MSLKENLQVWHGNKNYDLQYLIAGLVNTMMYHYYHVLAELAFLGTVSAETYLVETEEAYNNTVIEDTNTGWDGEYLLML